MDVTEELGSLMDEFHKLAHFLTDQDVVDLFAMADHEDGEAMLKETITDWRMSKKLNESELQSLADWFSSLSPFFKVGAAVLAIL